MPDDARSPKRKKTAKGSRQTFWRIGTALSATTWREERDTYEARADYRRNLAGTMSAREIMG
jgi:hypothetical protein